jgi:hypothetical protein
MVKLPTTERQREGLLTLLVVLLVCAGVFLLLTIPFSHVLRSDPSMCLGGATGCFGLAGTILTARGHASR